MRKLCICSAVFWLAIGSLVIVIQISQCHGFNRSRQAFAEEVTSRDFAPAYKSDISKLALSRVSIPISHSLRPVMIYGQNDQEQIFGQGVVFELEGRPVVITCSHLFPKDFGSCNYRIKHYFGGKEEDIAGVKPLYSSDKPDQTYPGLCLALIGSGKTIDGFDVFTDQSSHQGKMYLIDKPWPVQSLLTGKFYMVKGVMDNPRGDRGVVFGYDMPVGDGESGLGFIDDQGSLVILDGGLNLDDSLKIKLGIPAKQKAVFGYCFDHQTVGKK